MSFSIGIKKRSKWEYDTSAGISGGYGLIAASGGLIVLKNPSGESISFHYAGLGAGVGKHANLGKLNLKARTGGTFSLTNYQAQGAIYITEALERDELEEDDFRGSCLYVEGGLGFILGGSWSGFLFGCKVSPLIAAIGGPIMNIGSMIVSAKVLYLTGGVNSGIQAGVGASICAGVLK